MLKTNEWEWESRKVHENVDFKMWKELLTFVRNASFRIKQFLIHTFYVRRQVSTIDFF